ncbi:Alg9-like mannosyltransferase family-domain-containing protein [Dichotomocladium elegans]|nr:Alg9-like mannosyltransferase family-domain-containing protein [Dichotomocladium elegans]
MTTDHPDLRHRRHSTAVDTKPEGDYGESWAVEKLGMQRSTWSSRLFVFGVCLAFRIINAYLTRTFDNPDEYWQAQEIGHAMVFGYGYRTWEWRSQIRSYAHPLIFAVVYKMIDALGLSETSALLWAPKVSQACFSAVTDYATYTLGKRVMGASVAPYILLLTLFSWYNAFIAARTLSNSMEAMFTVLSLNYWPLFDMTASKIGEYRVALFLAACACVIRPTNAVLWLFMGTQLLLSARGFRITVLWNAFIIVSSVLGLDILVDTWIYTGFDHLVLTPFNFLKVNVFDSISLIYGVHPWHWYLSQGVPVVLTTLLPLAIHGYRASTRKAVNASVARRRLGRLIVWVITVYSLLSHKEFRFIYPILPLMLIFAAAGLEALTSKKRFVCLGLLLTQIPLAIYLNVWHQRGVIDVMLWLKSQSDLESVGVLMPCHSTPWQSMLHRPDIEPLWFLTCEPPIDQDPSTYVDEADRFYADPLGFLANITEWPSHLVMFDALWRNTVGVREYLETKGYSECHRLFNSHFHDDWRRRGDVVVICK